MWAASSSKLGAGHLVNPRGIDVSISCLWSDLAPIWWHRPALHPDCPHLPPEQTHVDIRGIALCACHCWIEHLSRVPLSLHGVSRISGRANVGLAGKAISSPALMLPIVEDCTLASAPRTRRSSYLGPVSPQAELKVALRLASWLVKSAVRQHDGVLLAKEQGERGGRVLVTGRMGMRRPCSRQQS